MIIEKPVLITIVIPVHNRKSDTLHCLRQLQLIDRNGMNITVIVVDDGSVDGTGKAVTEEFPEVVLLSGDGNLWWSGANNKGVRYALDHNSDYVLTLNNDVEFKRDFLIHLLKTARSYTNVIACAVICDLKDRNKIISGGRFAKGFLGYDYSAHLKGEDVTKLPPLDYESDIESGYAMLIPVQFFQEVGFFDSDKFPQNMGDMDFVLRAKKKGVKVLINPKSIIYAERSSEYFHSQIVSNSLLSNLKAFFQIKSTVHLRTRWIFCWRHTPYYLGWLSFFYFILRMCIVVVLKMILPTKVLSRIMKNRKRLPV